MKKYLRYIPGFSVVFVLVFPLSAFSATLSLECALGFNGYFQLETWAPLTVVLENRGRATNGTLEVIVTSGSEFLHNIYQTTYATEVELPYNSKKLCTFTILISTFTHDLNIRFRQADKTLLSRPINLRPYYTTKSFAVVLDERTSPDVLSVLPQSLLPVNVRPEFLPETWYGYESVKLLIINAGMLNRLREQQFRALVQWIKQGGYLVTAGGINYGALLEQRMQRLLPIAIVRHQQLVELPSLEDFCGQKLVSSEPFLVLQANIQDAEVVLQEQAIPIILQKTIGLGKILFLAVDFQNPPFSRWNGRQSFWNKLLSLQPVIEHTGIELDSQKIRDALLLNMPVGFPNVKVTFLFLGGYFVLLRVFLKKAVKPREKRRRNCGYLLMVITVFSIASYGFFFYPTDRKSLVYNSFALMNITGQHQIAFGKYIIGLYAKKDTVYTVNFGAGSYPVTHLLSKDPDKRVPGPYVLHLSDSGQRISGVLEKWSYNFFMIAPPVDFPVVGQALMDEQRLRLRIENRTPYQIVDCWVYFQSRVFVLGDILPNTEQIKDIPQADINSREPFTEQEAELLIKSPHPSSSLSFLKMMQKELAKDALLAVQSKYGSGQNTLCLIGWIPSGILQAGFGKAGISGENLTLIAWEIPVT